jgi:molybdate transport system regulatory protein
MNILAGEIAEIMTQDEISLVRVRTGTVLFSTLVIDSPRTDPGLEVGRHVRLLFKETEVIIAKIMPLEISIRNRIECTIRKITSGKLLCELTLSIIGTMPEVMIKSVITQNACEELRLREYDKILALIKTNEVSLLTND